MLAQKQATHWAKEIKSMLLCSHKKLMVIFVLIWQKQIEMIWYDMVELTLLQYNILSWWVSIRQENKMYQTTVMKKK